MTSPAPIVLILGPTAGGKTALAVDLARRVPGGGECLSADSMQVYRGMDIGTAKPSAAERAAVPHHLLDLTEPSDDSFSVDRWLACANEAIEEVRGRGRVPLVVGGTNLYVQALLCGMMDGPEPDPDLRARLTAMTGDELRAWLERVDPVAAERIHRNDRKRSIRAIEVHELTGRSLSDLQRQWPAGPRTDALIVGLRWSVEAINRRINDRVRSMMEAGLPDEVRRLWESGRLGRQAREALGYRQIVDHLEGRMTLDEAVEQIKIRSRRFAKQQRTWLRRFYSYPWATWLPADDLTPQTLVEHALTAIKARRNVPAADAGPAGRSTPNSEESA